MSGSNINKQGYFQGAGEGNEPAPGQQKYPKDPTNEKLRTDGDKHMDVDDMGGVDQLYPGDLERKKMLARANAEERAIKRNAAVNLAKQALEAKKEAYFQAGDKNPQEPTPGKPKYPVDKLNSDLREDGDKHMVGQKPFPGVGAVDGVHPSPASADVSDEKKRKELIQRASLRARFIKAANNDGTQNRGNSGWEVFLGDKLLLTASVNELSGNRAEILYDSIATKEFGSKLIEKVKVFGADKVRSLVKSAQEAPAAPAAPAAPVAPEAMPAPEAPAEPTEQAEDTGKSGDVKETVVDLSEKVRDLSSDLAEGIKTLTGEKEEMGALEEVAPVTAADESLNVLRTEINDALTTAMTDVVSDLNDHQQELEMIAGMCDKGIVSRGSNKALAKSIIEDAINETKTSIADGFKLMQAFVKYARGTKAMVKRAEIEAELKALAEGDTDMDTDKDTEKDTDAQSAEDLLSLISDTDSELEQVEGDLGYESDELSGLLEDELVASDDENDANYQVENQSQIPTNLKQDDVVTFKADDGGFDTVAERQIMRAKLASDALKCSPHCQEAHPKGKVTTKLDVKPTGDLAVVENLEEIHDAMMDLANAPPKVRKEAEAINTLVTEGKLDVADLDSLVAEGLDKDAVAYYRKYFGQVDGGSEFASELVKEHVKAQMEEALNAHKVKMARAYELAYDMVTRGICPDDRSAISAQVEEIMNFSDANFESLKRVVAKQAPKMSKQANRIPQVGLIGSGELTTAPEEGNLVSQLSAAFSKTSKKMF